MEILPSFGKSFVGTCPETNFADVLPAGTFKVREEAIEVDLVWKKRDDTLESLLELGAISDLSVVEVVRCGRDEGGAL